MREILFRAKAINRDPNREYRTNYKNGDWVYGLIEKLPFYNVNGEKFFEKDCAHMRNISGVSDIDVDENTICEYTGRKDKNGNEIFEGDFVKGTISSAWNKEEIICEVRSEDDGYYCVETRQGYEYKHKLRFSKKLEVVGNVFDNPNLIKGEK